MFLVNQNILTFAKLSSNEILNFVNIVEAEWVQKITCFSLLHTKNLQQYSDIF